MSDAVVVDSVVSGSVVNQEPSVFCDEEITHDISVDIYFDPAQKNSIVAVRKSDSTEVTELKKKTEVFTFSQPKYDSLMDYRQSSSVFVGGSFRVDPIKFRQMLLLKNLIGWTVKGKDGNIVPIKKDEEGGFLSDDSIVYLNKIAPSVLDVVMALYEKKLLLA